MRRLLQANLLQRAGIRSLFGTGLGSATGLVLPFALSTHFGAGGTTDRFAYTLTLVNFVGSLFDGTIQASTVPGLEYARREGRAQISATIRRYALRLPTAALVVYAVVIVVALGVFQPSAVSEVPGSPWLLASAFALFLCSLIVSSVASSTLYVFDIFFAPTATAGLRSCLPLLAVPFLGLSPASLLIVAGLMTVGETLRASYLTVRVVRKVQTSPRTLGPMHGQRPRTVSMGMAYGVSMLFAGLVPVATRNAAGGLAPGSITVLDLAEKLMFVPATALSAVFVVVAGARWSRIMHDLPRQLSLDVWSRIRLSIVGATAAGALLVVAVVVITAVAGPRFAGAPSGELRLTVAILALTLPAGVATSLCSRLLATLGHTRSIPVVGVLSLVVAGGGAFVSAPSFGLPGIAISLLAARLVALGCFVAFTRRALTPLLPVT